MASSDLTCRIQGCEHCNMIACNLQTRLCITQRADVVEAGTVRIGSRPGVALLWQALALFDAYRKFWLLSCLRAYGGLGNNGRNEGASVGVIYMIACW